MTSEEQIQYFVTRFRAYKAQVFRLVKEGAGRVLESANTQKLTGKSLADILAIIKGEINTHEQNANRPHGETLAQLGGSDMASFNSRKQNYFLKDAVPISKIPQVTATINNAQQTVALPAANIVYYGRRLTIPAKTLTLTTAGTQFVKVNFTGTVVNRTAEWTVDNNDNETDYLAVVGRVVSNGATFTATMFSVVRLGAATLSRTVRGAGIPTSPGSQATTGSISPDWFQ